MTDNVSKLPTPGVILDLDSETRDPKDIKPPFVVTIGGKEVTFADPSELDWADLAAVRIPGDLIRISLSSEDRNHIASLKLEAWKFNKLMEAYYTHYDLEAKIEQARRQAAFSGTRL